MTPLAPKPEIFQGGNSEEDISPHPIHHRSIWPICPTTSCSSACDSGHQPGPRHPQAQSAALSLQPAGSPGSTVHLSPLIFIIGGHKTSPFLKPPETSLTFSVLFYLPTSPLGMIVKNSSRSSSQLKRRKESRWRRGNWFQAPQENPPIFLLIEEWFPMTHLYWDYNTIEGREFLLVYCQILLASLKAAARWPPNLSKVYNMRQEDN